MKRFLALLALLLSLAGLTGCANAQTLVSMTVLDLDRQESLPMYPHGGRDYVEGRPGHRYAVVLQNLTGERVLAVVSVDGVNAISGQNAGSQQSGYVLEPWQRLEVRGWRKNLSEIAEFHFTSLGDSYAARTGRPQNVGVIGVAAFRERRTPVYPPANISQPGPVYPPTYPPSPYDGRYDRAEAAAEAQAAPRPSAPPPARSASGALADSAAPALESRREADYGGGYVAPAPRQQLGTGHGQRRWDAATVTQFVRESSRPNQVATVYYDAAESLIARGILRPRWPQPQPTPDAFPVGFAPDPY
jgi:hypothetical protein